MHCKTGKLKEIKVNTYSKYNIGCQSMTVYCAGLGLSLYLIDYDRNCQFGCIGPPK